MEVCPERDVYTEKTQRGHFSYCFTPKHHGGGSETDATWLPELSREEEFTVFDMADSNQLSDDTGNLYGLRIRATMGGREILELGTWHEQIARFWHESERVHWHGHPLWRVGASGPQNRKKQKYCPSKAVFDKMVEAGVVSVVQASRLKTGKHLRKL